MTPLRPQELSTGHAALLQHGAQRFRAEALHLNRAPVDAPDARMAEKRKAAAANERVLIRCRNVWLWRGLQRVKEPRYDVYHVNGRLQGIVAAGCVWWEEAVAIAKDALRGRVSISLAGTRTTFVNRGGLAVADASLVGATALTPDEGKGWRRPQPGEFLEVKT